MAIPATSDHFVDDLFAKLHADRQLALTKAASATLSRERVADAARLWWEEFCRIVEDKVSAWNAKDAAGAHVSWTKNPNGSVMLWHHCVEAELRLAEARVVMTGRIGDTRPRESPFIEFNEARGSVTAVLADNTAKSPAEAADHLLGPIFTRAFAG
jgi:hypothetical protein